MPRLSIIKGADEGKQVDLVLDCITIGRDGNNRLRLHDTEVSRKHAELVRTDNGYRVLDVGSANGTFVNGRKIHDVLLRPGDQIQIGQSVLLFSSAGNSLAKPKSESVPPNSPTRTSRPSGSAAPLPPPSNDLADRIHLISRQENFLPSAIKSSVGETEGSRILAKPETVEGPWLKAKLGIIYEAMQATSQILDLDELLDRLIGLIFQTLAADRGCVMLKTQADHEGIAVLATHTAMPTSADLEPRAVHVRRRASTPSISADEEKDIVVSQTIMDYVLREKQGILVSDASNDDRFAAVQSVVRSGVREIICVPMRGRHETLGLLYLDSVTPLRDPLNGVHVPIFTDDHLALAIAFAHQAALAVEDTRYYGAMIQSEHLAAVGQTIASISHHIKNILQNLRMGSEILAMGIEDEDFDLVKQGWHNLEKNQRKIYDMVLDMLSFSKEREPVIEMIDLNALVEEVVELSAARAKAKQVSLTLDTQEDLPDAPADREGLHRAILNVVSNATDAVEGTKNAKVHVRSSLDSTGEWFHLIVEDNGPGIPANKREEIFRPFVSSKGARGTGLGLPVSRKVLREHGGDIRIESESGKGCRFVLELPAKSQLLENEATREVPTKAPPPN